MQLLIESKNFDALIDQSSDQFRDCFVTRLSRWNKVRLRLTLVALRFDIRSTEFIEVAQVFTAKLRRHLENRATRDHFHRHDVAWAPLACRPRIGKICGYFSRVAHAARARSRELFSRDCARRHESRAGCFGKNSDGVVEVRRGAEAAVPPRVVECVC